MGHRGGTYPQMVQKSYLYCSSNFSVNLWLFWNFKNGKIKFFHLKFWNFKNGNFKNGKALFLMNLKPNPVNFKSKINKFPLSKSIECTPVVTPEVPLDCGWLWCINVGPSVVTHAPPWWPMLTTGEAVLVWGHRYMENSPYLALNFAVNLKLL